MAHVAEDGGGGGDRGAVGEVGGDGKVGEPIETTPQVLGATRAQGDYSGAKEAGELGSAQIGWGRGEE